MPDTGLAADIVILGAGPVGMALARALQDSPLRVLLVDARPRGAWATDPRALAIAHGSQQVLQRIDCWNPSHASAIGEIHVSQQGGFGRTLIQACDYQLPALGYVTRYHHLAEALDASLGDTQFLAPCRVDSIAPAADAIRLTLHHHGNPLPVTTKLLIHAEGTPHDDQAICKHDYRQHAIVAEVMPAQRHDNRAWERFTPDGPLALLPLENAYSLVMTVPADRADRLLSLTDQQFIDTLRQRFAGRLDFTSINPRAAFPLALRRRKTLAQDRQIWIGNAAQTLHPVTGQGFNLGLRDAWQLAEHLKEHRSSDPGDPALLAAYAGGRQPDRLIGAGLTDGFVRLFSNDILPLRVARGLGLLALDLAPTLRHLVAHQMISGTRAAPR